MGKRGSAADFHTAAEALAAGGAEVVAVPRGGETTYHGPGQLVVYPIVSLRELGVGARAYVEGLEDCMVRTLGRYGIAARVSICGGMKGGEVGRAAEVSSWADPRLQCAALLS